MPFPLPANPVCIEMVFRSPLPAEAPCSASDYCFRRKFSRAPPLIHSNVYVAPKLTHRNDASVFAVNFTDLLSNLYVRADLLPPHKPA